MKRTRTIALAAATLLALTACGGRTQTFSAADGSVRATVKEGTNQWRITDAQGHEPMSDYDSMRVVELSEEGSPMTVCYHHGNEQLWLQYYSDMTLRAKGRVVDGRREGPWVYYHADGSVQTECTFVGGLEEGSYRVYRQGGIPYYIGQYTHGVRSGKWEVYDASGNLVAEKEY